MRATGIVRRIDDLGRVVIPKEIRKMMGIREGDPLEIYTDNGTVCFHKYHPIGDHNWSKAKAVVKQIFSEPFALYDRYEECKAYTMTTMSENFDTLGERFKVHNIYIDGEIEGYLITVPECENAKIAVQVLAEILSND